MGAQHVAFDPFHRTGLPGRALRDGPPDLRRLFQNAGVRAPLQLLLGEFLQARDAHPDRALSREQEVAVRVDRAPPQRGKPEHGQAHVERGGGAPALHAFRLESDDERQHRVRLLRQGLVHRFRRDRSGRPLHHRVRRVLVRR